MIRDRKNLRGKNGDPTSASDSGAPSARTIAKAVTPGITSPTIRPAHVPTAGGRTALPAFPRTNTTVPRRGRWERERTEFQRTASPVYPTTRQPRRGCEGVLLLPRQ